MIEIYGKDDCYYCQEAKKVADQYNLKYTFKNTLHGDYRAEMFERYPEAKTVPQIWWDGRHIGGYTEFAREIENTLGDYGQAPF